MKKCRAAMPWLFVSLLLSACVVPPGPPVDRPAALNLRPAWVTEAVFDNPASVVFDPVATILLVANVNGPAMKKDGNGYLSKVALNGVVLDRHWLTGLDGPKGMALRENTLYVADITNLAVIDLTSGLMEKHPAPGAKFLNDVTVDNKGRVYVSDTYTDTIYRSTGTRLDVWLRDKRLASPNGLFAQGNTLYVGSWGVRQCGMETEVPGELLAIDLDSKEIRRLGSGAPLGNLEGVEGLGSRGFLITDPVQGTLIHLGRQGEVVETMALGQGAGDLTVLPADWELVVVPMVQDNVLRAYILPVP
jgi:hypothetical protein